MEEDVLILADGLVLTCDPENRAGRLTLVVRSGKVVEIGEESAAIVRRYPGAGVVSASGMLVLPGFVNAHIHSESLALRELTAGLPMSEWKANPGFRAALGRLGAPGAGSDVATIVRAGAAAHLKSGTTTAAEMPRESETDVFRRAVHAAGESGMRSLWIVRTWDQLSAAREMSAAGHAFGLDLGAEEDLTVYGLESRIRAAGEAGIPLCAHLGETGRGVELVRRNFQKPLLHVLRDFGALQTDTLCVHLNHCVDADARAVQEAGCTITLCIRAAMAKNTGYPFLQTLTSNDVRLAIGTDWGSFDVLAEIRLFAQLPSLVQGIPEFTPVECLRMATINGAEALGMGTETGSIEPGKRADLVLMRLDDIRVPAVRSAGAAEDLASLLVLSPHAPTVSDVLVNGVFQVREGRLALHDEQELLADLQQVRERWGFGTSAWERPSSREEAHAPVPARSRVFQFVPRDPDLHQDPLSVPPRASAGPPHERTANLSAPRRRAAPTRSANHPELPKDVRRIFGEDDES